MAKQSVMDQTGDTLTRAEARFRKLNGNGFMPAIRTVAVQTEIIRSFDLTAGETLYLPRLVSG